MAGPKRWPPLLIPQLPQTWLRAGFAVAVVASVVMSGNAFTTRCGFGDELCHPALESLAAITTAVFWFWLLAPCVLIAIGTVHIARVTVSWLRLDVLRPRRA